MSAKIEYRDLTEEQSDAIEEKWGDVVATKESVANYLTEMYNLTVDEANALVEKYAKQVQNGNELGSYTYYVAEEIRDEELTPPF